MGTRNANIVGLCIKYAYYLGYYLGINKQVL